MSDLVTQMNAALSKVAAHNGFRFVNVNAGFGGHRLCDTGTPWFQYKLSGLISNEYIARDGGVTEKAIDEIPDLPDAIRGVFHPTAEGQTVYTQALEHALKCS